MFNKLKKTTEQPLEESILKYEKPNILLVDLPEESLTAVKQAGFNVYRGSFGTPYKIEKSDKYCPVIGTPSLPNYAEQEIIFIDLTPPDLQNQPEGEKTVSEGELDWWTSCSLGHIDPRPKFMDEVCGYSDRILRHGGVFVIFAQPYSPHEFFIGQVDQFSKRLDRLSKVPRHNWAFLPIFSSDIVNVKSDSGVEVKIPNGKLSIYSFLRKYASNMEYVAHFDYSDWQKTTAWEPIIFSKYDKPIGGILSINEYKGFILILPQILNKSEAIIDLLQEVLPDIVPSLFPHTKRDLWTQEKEYELEKILEYIDQKTEIQNNALRELEKLDKKIEQERENFGFLHNMLTQTGDELVKSVKLCFEKIIGFQKVIDVDEEMLSTDPNAPKQEDLQIHDRDITLLVEIKGLSNLPREKDTIQIVKYIARRMKEWKKTEIHGVFILNHQRNLPALQRNNANVFTDQQIGDAKNHDFTILTTWDLFCLLKGMLKWKWNPTTIQDLLYSPGRMPILPTIYKPIGVVEHFWEKPGVVGIRVKEGSLRKDERIGYVLPNDYLEENVSSLQCENKDVLEVIPEQLAGVKTLYSKKVLSKGTLVCRIEM